MDNPIRRAICVDNTEYETDLLQGKEYLVRTDKVHPDFIDVFLTATNTIACYAYRFKDVEEIGDAWSTP